MTPDEESRLREIIHAMRKHAAVIGPMHSWWDDIGDMEQLLLGRPTIVKRTAAEWITYGQQKLDARSAPARG